MIIVWLINNKIQEKMTKAISDAKLREAVESVFKKYDVNEDSRLENF